MPRSIEVNPELGAAILPGRIMQELYAHARDTAPEECCGLITGTEDANFLSSFRIANVMTMMHAQDPAAFPRDSHQAYFMAVPEVLEVTRQAEEKGEQVTAVYHSHVGSGVYLSGEDLSFAEHPLYPFPGAAQLVLSVLIDADEGSVAIEGSGLFLFDVEKGGFDRTGGRRIEVAGE